MFLLISLSSSCLKDNTTSLIDNRIKEALYKYVNENEGYHSFFIMSSSHFSNDFNVKSKYISGVLIGPMYDGFFDCFGDLKIYYMMDVSGKQIYIDSTALFLTNGFVQNKQINFCKKDSFILCETNYDKTYVKNACLNYAKRAIVLNILVKNNIILDVEILNADTLYLPIIKADPLVED